MVNTLTSDYHNEFLIHVYIFVKKCVDESRHGESQLCLYAYYICTCCFLASCLEAVASPSPSSISERSSSSSSSGGVTATRVVGDYYHVFCKTIHSKHIPHIVRTPYAFLHYSSYNNNTLPCSVSPSSF